jgi:hypothetical protein
MPGFHEWDEVTLSLFTGGVLRLLQHKRIFVYRHSGSDKKR